MLNWDLEIVWDILEGFILNGHCQSETNQKKNICSQGLCGTPQICISDGLRVAEVAISQPSRIKQDATLQVSNAVYWIHGFKAEEGLA